MHEQYVWSQRYIDAPILRDRDSDGDGDPDDGDLGQEDSGLDERLYYLTDVNMNVTALVNTDGEAAERYAYDPYGRVTVLHGAYGTDPDVDNSSVYEWDEDTTPDVANEVLFCGYRINPETGLYQVRNRDYHPTLGRWLQRDPLGYVDGMSLYEYVGSGPVIGLDPAGKAVIEWFSPVVLGAKLYNTVTGGGNSVTRAITDTAGAAEDFGRGVVGAHAEVYIPRRNQTLFTEEQLTRDPQTTPEYYGRLAGRKYIFAKGVVEIAAGIVAIGDAITKPVAGGIAGGVVGGPAGALEGTVAGVQVCVVEAVGGVVLIGSGIASAGGASDLPPLNKPNHKDAGSGGNTEKPPCPKKGEPPLKRIHSDKTLSTGSNKYSLEHWRKQSTEDIVNSLKPGQKEALRVKPDGRVFNGNTRIKVLEERGYDINSLPREAAE